MTSTRDIGAERRPIALCCANLKPGGVQRMTLLIAECLLRRGWPVDLLVADNEGQLTPPEHEGLRIVPLAQSSALAGRAAVLSADPGGLPVNLRPLVLPVNGFPTLRNLPALARYLRAERPRAVFAPMPDFIFSTTLAKRMARSDTQIVASFRSHLTGGLSAKNKARGRTFLPALRRALGQVSGVHAVSHAVADDLAQTCGLDRRAIQVFHSPTLNGDVEALAAASVEHPWLAPEREVPVVVAVGRISPQKDYETLFRALAIARQERPLRLVVVGDDSPLANANGRSKKITRAVNLLKELELEEAIDFVGYQENPLAWIAKADVFALSSRFEGLPNVVIEALACGRSVVATDAPGGTAEILQDGRYGHLAPVGDAPALARALLRAVEAPADPEVQKARAADFDWQSSLAAYERLLTGEAGALRGPPAEATSA
ncbi:glycosyltransferase [Fodinicurvata sediminis]|uniref:glycosyltransferase n=1 Tax=Fodinicurvata sediminis TaxID=1121832 RepID=UPI0003B7A182|nr:glycosyltransferase [Fodinicurvata sediminis]